MIGRHYADQGDPSRRRPRAANYAAGLVDAMTDVLIDSGEATVDKLLDAFRR